MSKKKEINVNLPIILFFRGLSTTAFDDGDGYLSSKYNLMFNIYKCKNYKEKLQKLAVMFLNDNVKDIEQLDYVKNVIDKWLSKALSNGHLFSSKKIIANPEKSLFENRTIEDTNIFCQKFRIEIENIMLNFIKDRFLVFPVKNFFKESFSYGLMGYIKKGESKENIATKYLSKEYFDEIYIDSVTTAFLYDIYNNNIFKDADGFIYIKTHVGENFLSKSEHDIKNFMTVCLSTADEKPSSISICLREQFIMSATFDDFKNIYYNEFRNPIIPSIANGQIDSFDFEEVDKWYKRFNDLELEKKERIDRCIYLINNAFSNKKYKKFVDICQGIDALFGVEKKVNVSIKGNLKNIIKKYNGENIFLEKIDKLWMLRNSLVHGSIKDIRDSKIYLEYQLKYLRCPEDDYLDLSLFCIKHAVNYFHSGYFLDFKNNDSKLKSYLKKKMKKLNDWVQAN